MNRPAASLLRKDSPEDGGDWSSTSRFADDELVAEKRMELGRGRSNYPVRAKSTGQSTGSAALDLLSAGTGLSKLLTFPGRPQPERRFMRFTPGRIVTPHARDTHLNLTCSISLQYSRLTSRKTRVNTTHAPPGVESSITTVPLAISYEGPTLKSRLVDADIREKGSEE